MDPCKECHHLNRKCDGQGLSETRKCNLFGYNIRTTLLDTAFCGSDVNLHKLIIRYGQQCKGLGRAEVVGEYNDIERIIKERGETLEEIQEEIFGKVINTNEIQIITDYKKRILN